ncbi:MAG: methyltransferase domain-containing protein [Ignavibacteria bacterium]|nr:methyltransferase domain-containing protein [Ignavibacteria bacterium]
MNPFRREPMLELMNRHVFESLKLDESDEVIFDLGCGLAAPCRSFAKNYPGRLVKGITIVEWQIEKAKVLNRLAGVEDRIEMILGDYTNLGFENNSADAAYALESACHCPGDDKAAFVQEMMRVLKPGKSFVIVDGFLKRPGSKFNRLLKYCYREICKGWALPSFPNVNGVTAMLEKCGAEIIEVTDLSFRVAPSVMHAPFTVVSFLLKKMLQGEKLNSVRLGHLKACFLGLILGMHRGSFSYIMISGVKKK